MEIQNKKAYFNYFVEKEYEVGIELRGFEVKAIRNGEVNLKDSYVIIRNNEAWVLNMFIARYQVGSSFDYANYDENRTRRLLLHRREIKKLRSEVTENGKTLIPVKLYFKNGRVKLLIALAKGKKLYDKRQAIKERDLKRDVKLI